MSGIEITLIDHERHGKCVKLSNGIIDVIATIEFGPRIVRYGFVGKQNEFIDNLQWKLQVDNREWIFTGGHRLWSGPETFPRTYIPDNDPVEWVEVKDGIKLIQEVQPWSQIKKEIEIVLSRNDSKVKLNHILENNNAWAVEYCGWALTMMAPGGKEIIPQNRTMCHFSEGSKNARTITLWPFTRMDDKRVYWGKNYIILNHDSSITENIKFGTSNTDGWSAYINRGNMFLKRFEYKSGAKYPDFGVSFETFANALTLEIESLSPMVIIEPKGSLIHKEEWELFDGIKLNSNDENEIDKIVQGYIIKKLGN